jgi:predicted RNase H-like HicB family nuclease
MEKLMVKISWSGTNYSALIENINGSVVATGDNLTNVKKEIESAFEFHIESSLDDDDPLPEYITNGNYQFDFYLLASALLKEVDGFINRSALSSITKINKKQLGHYIQGKREARVETRNKIAEGIKQISQELLHFV